MKKFYTKPLIIFEDFSLSTNIANCEEEINFSKDSCKIVTSSGETVFNSGCDYSPEELGHPSDTYNGFCYHVPTSDRNFFNS